MTFYPHSFFVSCCFLWKQFCCDLLSFQHPPAPAILRPTSISFSFSSTRCLLLKLHRKLHFKRSTEYFIQSDIIHLLCSSSPSFLRAKINRKMTAISMIKCTCALDNNSDHSDKSAELFETVRSWVQMSCTVLAKM